MSEEKKRISLPLVGGEDEVAQNKTREEGGDVMSEIAHEVESNKIVLYMKGTPEQPMCGFSHRAVSILQSYGVPLYSVNILADQEKRQAIKEFSEWPTIPQIYVNGAFLGGSDLLMQMHETGQLEDVLREAFEI
ncbi:MAG: Grx4 family monothiol glutaredoxin [Myxococcota bacterium]